MANWILIALNKGKKVNGSNCNKKEKQVQSRKVKWDDHIKKGTSPSNNTIIGISSSLKVIILHIHCFGVITIIRVDLKAIW